LQASLNRITETSTEIGDQGSSRILRQNKSDVLAYLSTSNGVYTVCWLEAHTFNRVVQGTVKDVVLNNNNNNNKGNGKKKGCMDNFHVA
jgi:hypothetical protein